MRRIVSSDRRQRKGQISFVDNGFLSDRCSRLEHMFDGPSTLRPGSFDAATGGDVGAILGRWVVEDPCPQAVAELAGIDPTSLGDADRVRLLIGLERQAAWVTAMALPVTTRTGGPPRRSRVGCATPPGTRSNPTPTSKPARTAVETSRPWYA
jgi:hypothetical protein